MALPCLFCLGVSHITRSLASSLNYLNEYLFLTHEVRPRNFQPGHLSWSKSLPITPSSTMGRQLPIAIMKNFKCPRHLPVAIYEKSDIDIWMDICKNQTAQCLLSIIMHTRTNSQILIPCSPISVICMGCDDRKYLRFTHIHFSCNPKPPGFLLGVWNSTIPASYFSHQILGHDFQASSPRISCIALPCFRFTQQRFSSRRKNPDRILILAVQA